jgi:hypothetical protein
MFHQFIVYVSRSNAAGYHLVNENDKSFALFQKKNADMFTGAKFLEAFHCDIKENIQ